MPEGCQSVPLNWHCEYFSSPQMEWDQQGRFKGVRFGRWSTTEVELITIERRKADTNGWETELIEINCLSHSVRGMALLLFCNCINRFSTEGCLMYILLPRPRPTWQIYHGCFSFTKAKAPNNSTASHYCTLNYNFPFSLGFSEWNWKINYPFVLLFI